ncbi:MAG: hypothetical protein ACJ8G8_07165, partial [Pseudomonas sp.]
MKSHSCSRTLALRVITEVKAEGSEGPEPTDKLACLYLPVHGKRADHMAKTFELETLKMRLNDAEFQLLDLH